MPCTTRCRFDQEKQSRLGKLVEGAFKGECRWSARNSTFGNHKADRETLARTCAKPRPARVRTLGLGIGTLNSEDFANIIVS
eukprot:319884-Amphidinium_carterae.1